MTIENVSLNAGGMAYNGWHSVEVTAGADEAARSFTLDVTEEGPTPSTQPWIFPPGTPVTITAGGDILVDGYVDDYNPSFNPTSHTINVTGRSKSKDAIDSSAVDSKKTGRYEKMTTLEQANDLGKKMGVKYTTDQQLKPIPWTQIRPGETQWQFLNRQLLDQGMFMQGMPDGSIKITKGGSESHSGGLIQGVNIIEANSTISEKGKHSEYDVKGQSSRGTGESSTRPRHKVKDSSVNRYRPKVIVNEGESDKKRVQKRAEWEAAKADGWSKQAEITVLGWRDDGGQLWMPNKQVYVSSPFLRLDQNMLIKRVVFRQSNDAGTVAALSLVDPKALGAKGDSKSKSASGVWGGPQIKSVPDAQSVSGVNNLSGVST